MATSIDGAMCQRHMFSTDRNGVQTNTADENLDQRNVRLISVGYSTYQYLTLHLPHILLCRDRLTASLS